MKKVIMLSGLLMVVLAAQVSVQAEEAAQVDAPATELNLKGFYAGGGLGSNSLPGFGSARGFQFFGGYNFNFVLNDDIHSALEIGYMDSGKFDNLLTGTGNNKAVKGLWVAMVESVPLTSKVDMLARLGYDFGDDDGFILGAGMQYKFDTRIAMRMEYVTREYVNGLQVNVLVNF